MRKDLFDNLKEISENYGLFRPIRLCLTDIQEIFDVILKLRDEIDRLEAEVNTLQEAWLIDESIQPDGSLRPSIVATIMRLQGRIDDLEAK
jgi:uncharacterized small protein (DUF1192 family)